MATNRKNGIGLLEYWNLPAMRDFSDDSRLNTVSTAAGIARSPQLSSHCQGGWFESIPHSTQYKPQLTPPPPLLQLSWAGRLSHASTLTYGLIRLLHTSQYTVHSIILTRGKDDYE